MHSIDVDFNELGIQSFSYFYGFNIEYVWLFEVARMERYSTFRYGDGFIPCI